MRQALKALQFFTFAAALALAASAVAGLYAPAAVAFTIENKDSQAGGLYAVPKFDLEEQARNFRAGNPDAASGAKREFDTPLGQGSLQFGVQQGPAAGSAFGFGSSLGPVPGSRAGRADFNRVVTPENLR